MQARGYPHQQRCGDVLVGQRKAADPANERAPAGHEHVGICRLDGVHVGLALVPSLKAGPQFAFGLGFGFRVRHELVEDFQPSRDSVVDAEAHLSAFPSSLS